VREEQFVIAEIKDGIAGRAAVVALATSRGAAAKNCGGGDAETRKARSQALSQNMRWGIMVEIMGSATVLKNPLNTPVLKQVWLRRLHQISKTCRA